MAAPRVFVSHHHSPQEDAFTARLVADLQAAGADVWVDTSGVISDDFVRRISEGLAGRQWLVLVMTPAALASPWVQREVNVALAEHTAGRMLGVLPLVMKPCREQDIPMLWRTLHRYDAANDYASARNSLLRTLTLPLPVPQLSTPQPSQSAPMQSPQEAALKVVSCPGCRALNFPSQRFCTICGGALAGGQAATAPTPVVCRNCGWHTVPGQRFCVKCGHGLG
jgi:hypothetical protein